jgi:hypothetical protein
VTCRNGLHEIDPGSSWRGPDGRRCPECYEARLERKRTWWQAWYYDPANNAEILKRSFKEWKRGSDRRIEHTKARLGPKVYEENCKRIQAAIRGEA